ncbi:MAG: helicase HerA domain-containing protein [Opitutaceae bacterium]
MPETSMLPVADAIANHCLKDARLHLVLKIASTLTEHWSNEGQQTVEQKGWADERGNLTHYRNIPETPEKCTIVVLCGADRVTDAAGLDDFHTCDHDMIWSSEMRKSFKGWIEHKLSQAGFTDYTPDDLSTFDRIVKPILTCGRGDLLQISDWLDKLELSNVDDISDIPHFILRNLDTFGFPVLSRFPLKQKRKQLAPYINKSEEFFNYTLFLEASRREKAIKTLSNILSEIKDGNQPNLPIDDEDVLGPYSSGEDFIEGLLKYVENDDQTERNRLMECDFVVIWDDILKFKMIRPKTDRDSVRKLSGGPVEVLLTALWTTLKDFYHKNKGETELSISSITIRTSFFKHDIESGDDTEENAELARNYLRRLIGGIDPLIDKHVNLCNADDSDIAINCQLLTEDITCRYGKSAEPLLVFEVEIAQDEKPYKQKYGWKLPEHHMYRLSVDLLKSASDSMANLSDIYKLPVYHISYYEELLQATADEEIRRVLQHSIRDERDDSKTLTNLLGNNWVHQTDPLKNQLKQLAEKYDIFIKNASTKGVLATVFDNTTAWTKLRQSYADVFEAAIELDDINQSSMVGMLVRAFLVVGPRPSGLGDSWHADAHEPSGIATILHPSVIEMLEAQVVYLCRCFNYKANEELQRTPTKDSFRAYIWQTYTDLSQIQSPLSGLLHNEEKNLTAKVRGGELLHRIGTSSEVDTPLSTRLLVQYNDNPEEEDSISDSEMFHESSESILLLRLMQDYFDLHPYARDGLSVAVFRNEDIQPVIAAIHTYLKELAREPTAKKPNKRYVLRANREKPYAISVTLFTESSDETDVSSWVDQWQECWEAAETEKKYELYRRCRFSIAHRLVEKKDLSSFQKLINEQFEADIAVFYNFIGAGEGVNKFEKVEPFDLTSRELKFPILEKACCTIDNPAEKYRRKRVVSNRQFALSAYHANLLHALQSNTHQTGTVVVGSGDFSPWRSIIDSLHKKVEWLICVDPNMDERLIKTPKSESEKEREIIGFGSGVGSHGEDNYTISTEQFSLIDICSRIKASIQQLYAPGADWSVEDCDTVAQGVLQLAPELSGLSLVRATGVGDEYIRDFMAYALTRKLLPKDNCLCESLISLDAYRHWFDLSENKSRPDLMWMRVELGEDQRLHIKMQLIECKLANASEEHVQKAKSQIDNGIKILSSAFAPLIKGSTDERPDWRYWWMQLHRLIASKAEVYKQEYPKALAALERLAEGNFEISWSASIFAYWIDQNDTIQRIGFWNPNGTEEITANAYTIGGKFVRNLFCNADQPPVDWSSFADEGEEIIDEEGLVIDENSSEEYTPGDNDSEEDNNGDLPEDAPSPLPSPEASPSVAPHPLTASANTGPSGTPPTPSHSSEPKVNQPPATDNPAQPIANVTSETPSPASAENDTPSQSGRILLGRTVSNDQPVYWEFKHPELANRHMLIFGSSGQGKTYAIQAMLSEMSKFRQNSLIIDYTNGFLPNHLEDVAKTVLSPKQHVVRQQPLPINPFLPQVADNGGIVIEENSNAVAKRVAGLFDSVYNIGNQQYSVLHSAVMEGVSSRKSGMNLNHMLSIIEAMAEDKKYKAYAQSLLNKLRPFVLDEPFSSGEGSFDWDHLFLEEDPLCNIFQLAGMDMLSSRTITEFILWDLYGHLQSKGKKTDPKVIVLDEVQNLDHKEGSPLSKYLREGRKFGVSLLLATQTMSNMKKDERDRMFNAEHKLFFRPADTELKAFAEIAALSTRQKVDDWVQKLSSLGKGECYSIGRMLSPDGSKLVTRALKIRITAMEDREFES